MGNEAGGAKEAGAGLLEFGQQPEHSQIDRSGSKTTLKALRTMWSGKDGQHGGT